MARRFNLAHFGQNLAARTIIGGALLLPYRIRVPFVGWVMASLLSPLVGWNKRVRDNLAHVMPELTPQEISQITRQVSNNVGRTLIEIYSGEDFIKRIENAPIEGPGVAALEAAKDRPAVLLTAHFGNYDAVRGKLSRRGYPMGALYKPMRNARFQEHYLKAISKIAEPVFPTDGRGIAGLIRMLKNGGNIGIVADVASLQAPILGFFGKAAHTPVSAAEWALKHQAAMIPIFGIRDSDGLSFRIHVAEEIPHSTAEEMMQAYNDAVEEMARKYPGQWFWIHRRWKGSGGKAQFPS